MPGVRDRGKKGRMDSHENGAVGACDVHVAREEDAATWPPPARHGIARFRPVFRTLPPRGGARDSPHAASPALGSLWEVDPEGDESDAPAEERLARLAAAFGPLRRVLAAISERLIATKAYERLCYARLGDYARERPGISVRQIQELARVHRALAGLPALERALVSNELPWSKVRLLARVATAWDEEAWISLAQAISTHRLEERVRRGKGIDRLEAAGDATPEKRVVLHCTPAVREKWSGARELAERVCGQRPRDAEVLELVAAEEFSAVSVAPLLRVVTSSEFEWRDGFSTLPRYAREQLGMSAGKARALLRLERVGDVCPELRHAYRRGRLSWVKAQCLVPLLHLDLDGEWRPVWVAWAERVTVRRLEADVERALLLRAGHHQAWQRL